MQRFKQRVWEVFSNPPEGDRLGNFISFFILILIGLNVSTSILETEESLRSAAPAFFYNFELFSVIIFSIEYVARMWSCTSQERFRGGLRGRARFAMTPMAIVDFLAIMPFYVEVLLAGAGLDLRFVRALRLFRLFRIFKLSRYAESFRILARVLTAQRSALLVSLAIVFLVVTLTASVMFICEHEAQPDKFSSVPATMWWAVITITTIGYGDLSPITTEGQIVGGIVAIIGVATFAMPIAIIGTGFIEEFDRRKNEEAMKEAGILGQAMHKNPHLPSIDTHCPNCNVHLRIHVEVVHDEPAQESAETPDASSSDPVVN